MPSFQKKKRTFVQSANACPHTTSKAEGQPRTGQVGAAAQPTRRGQTERDTTTQQQHTQ